MSGWYKHGHPDPPKRTHEGGPKMTERQTDFIEGLCNRQDIQAEEAVDECFGRGKKSWPNLTVGEASELINWLQEQQ